mmetsp:Transcript_81005/g.212668  ORF Transcript_81005/g.212668 Transcript_81005/m.212668 type:complete len:264 (-) Transcript_81005:24-815(-)
MQLHLPPGIVPEDDVLRPLPDACPWHAALRLGFEAGPPAIRAGLQVADPEEVAEGLALQGQAGHHAGVHHDQRQPREGQRQGQLPDPADVLLRDLVESVVAIALQAFREVSHAVPGLQQVVFVVAAHGERTVLSRDLDHLPAARALVHKVAHKHQSVARCVEALLVEEQLKLLRAAVDVADDDQPPARTVADVPPAQAPMRHSRQRRAGGAASLRGRQRPEVLQAPAVGQDALQAGRPEFVEHLRGAVATHRVRLMSRHRWVG